PFPVQPRSGADVHRLGKLSGGIPFVVPPPALGPSPEERPYALGRPGDQIPGRGGPGTGNDPDLEGHGALCGSGPPPSGQHVAGDPAQGGHLVEGCLYALFPWIFKNGFSQGNGKAPAYPGTL